MKRSHHATHRMQQRGISLHTLRFLEFYGTEVTQKGGTRVLYLSRKDQKRLRQDIKRLSDCLGNDRSPYFVLDDETVVTAGHLQKKPSQLRGYE